jgi:hypothetical protein
VSDERLKIILGFTLAVLIVGGIEVLSALIGIGKVEEPTSHGLSTLLESLKLIGAAWMGAMAVAWWNTKPDPPKTGVTEP